MTKFTESVRRFFGKDGKRSPVLPHSVVEHDPIDELVFDDMIEEAPRLRRAMADRPIIAPDAVEPEAIDASTATQEEVLEWQRQVKEARAKRDEAKPYSKWDDLVKDVFYAAHTLREDGALAEGAVDPTVDHHRKVVSRITNSDHYLDARAVTKFNDLESAAFTIGTKPKLREALETELVEQARRADEMEELRSDAEDLAERLEALRGEAKDRTGAGKLPLPDQLKQDIKDAVNAKRKAQQAFADKADQLAAIPFSQKANELVQEAAAEGTAEAQKMANVPGFSQGFGAGDMKKVDPETAMTIAEMWATNPNLKRIAELLGKINPDMRYKRAKRIEGGAEEIVDVILGDDLRHVLPSEYVLLADDDLEDVFIQKLYTNTLTMYEKVGEANAGRGPIALVQDESGSMSGDRNCFSKAVGLTLLQIARQEKRDFFAVSYSSGGQVAHWIFRAKDPIDPEMVLEWASHFFSGGTTPIIGISKAAEIIRGVPEFSKADIVLVSDGEAGFGPEDERIRAELEARAVRRHGIGIGGSFGYLKKMCETVDSVHDFELAGPNEATTSLATHIN